MIRECLVRSVRQWEEGQGGRRVADWLWARVPAPDWRASVVVPLDLERRQVAGVALAAFLAPPRHRKRRSTPTPRLRPRRHARDFVSERRAVIGWSVERAGNESF